jgi:predicted nucleotidyltransferase
MRDCVGDNQAMNEKLQTILQELREKLAAEYGDRLVNVILFGSQARGDATWESDIDVMVVLKDEVNPFTEIDRTSEMISELSLKYDTLISRLTVSEQRYRKGQSPLLINVRREGVSI